MRRYDIFPVPPEARVVPHKDISFKNLNSGASCDPGVNHPRSCLLSPFSLRLDKNDLTECVAVELQGPAFPWPTVRKSESGAEAPLRYMVLQPACLPSKCNDFATPPRPLLLCPPLLSNIHNRRGKKSTRPTRACWR